MKRNIFSAQRIILSFLLIALYAQSAFSQTPYASLTIKENYDETYRAFLAHNLFNSELSERYGTYESLLDMYEVTGDKAYLYRFMTAAIEMQNLK